MTEKPKRPNLTIRLDEGERADWEDDAGMVPLSRWAKNIINEHLRLKREKTPAR